jgi:predicted Zn finger-like uncharacterized protein
MNYRTTCPHCASVFRLGADQLDAAQGWVQCSVCGAAFDARPGLLQADGSPLPPPEPSPPEPVEAETALHEAADIPLAPAAAEAAEALPADAVPEADTEAATPVGIAQREAAPDLSSIILIDPDQPPADDDPGPLPQIPGQPTMPPVYPPHPWSGPLAETTPPPRPVMAQVEYAQPQMRPAVPGSATVPYTPRRARTGLWVAASLVLLLMLAAQAAYFLRDTLVSQWPQTRPALEQMCATLGCTLSLPKNQWVGSCQNLVTLPRKRSIKFSRCEATSPIHIVGSDLQIEPNGNLVLTLTLGNRDNYAQAWPVLVLTLTDQRNRALARRSFAPSEYLGDTPRIAAGIPPRSEQPLSLPLTVQDLTPMGFDLQLVY